MSSLRDYPQFSSSGVDAVDKFDASDGRVMRRQRNIAAVREAVLDILNEGETPTLVAIADRAGVATRSVYRYFGDVDTAVEDALVARRNRALEVFESEPTFSMSAPLEERLGMLVLRRLRLDRLVAPLCARGELEDLRKALDVEVLEAFAPELAVVDDRQLGLMMCAMFRLRSVRAMREVFHDEDQAVASAMMRAAAAVLGGVDPSA